MTIESTSKIVRLMTFRGEVEARLWQGTTEHGTPVVAFITRLMPEVPEGDPRFEDAQAEFRRDLLEAPEPRAAVDSMPLRLIL